MQKDVLLAAEMGEECVGVVFDKYKMNDISRRSEL
jgi:hypothetical protein